MTTQGRILPAGSPLVQFAFVRYTCGMRSGQKFGFLTLIRKLESVPTGKRGAMFGVWLCSCSCGVEKAIRENNLKSGHTISCGHYVRTGMNLKHGHSRKKKESLTYSSWTAMRERCLNEKHRAYSRYGGRGITICERWKDFSNFLSDVGERPSKLFALDRINNDGNYEPGNVRWASRSEQRVNQGERRLKPRKTCRICGALQNARGLCAKHYAQAKREGGFLE